MKYPEIDPVALSLGPLQVHWYGLMYLMGFVGAWYFLRRRSRPRKSDGLLQQKQIDDLLFYAACGIIFGGRVGYVVFYGLDRLLQEPLWLFYVWEGGMSFHGGFLGVLLAMLLYGRKVGKNPVDLLDFVAPVVPIGLGLGRLGNFIGQELWGRATDAPWGMVFPRDPLALVRHPSQLYEAFLEGLVLFLILYIYSARPRPRFAVSGLFLLCYGTFRFVVEFAREPDAHLGYDLFGWMSRGQLLCIPMILGGFLCLYLSRSHEVPKP